MKLLFVLPDEIEEKDGNHYGNAGATMIKRYEVFCDEIICFAPIKKVDTPKSDLIISDKVRYISAPKINTLKGLLSYYKYKRIIHDIIKNCDGCIINVHTSFTSTIAADICKKIKKPYLTVVVGCAWDAFWNHGYKGKLLAPIVYANLKRVQRHAQYSIYVTSKFLQSRYPSSGHQISCSNVELGSLSIPSLRLEKIKSGILSGKKIATVAAVDVPYKGQEYVIKALSVLKNKGIRLDYYLIGQGDNERLMTTASKYGVTDQVHFKGAIPHAQILKFLDDIDIYIQPSKQEGLPRALIEAMSRGCICLGSNIAGIPELLEEEYLFDKGNVEQIVRILSNISKKERIEEVERNIQKASLYVKKILDKRRSDFIGKFVSSILQK